MRLTITGILTLIIFIMVSVLKNKIETPQTTYESFCQSSVQMTEPLFYELPEALQPCSFLREAIQIPYDD